MKRNSTLYRSGFYLLTLFFTLLFTVPVFAGAIESDMLGNCIWSVSNETVEGSTVQTLKLQPLSGDECTLASLTTDAPWINYADSIQAFKIPEDKIVKTAESAKYLFGSLVSCTDWSGLANLSVTSTTTSFSYMFSWCAGLTDLSALSSWDVSNVTDFSYMFSNCSGLQNLKGLENWNVSNATNFYVMFSDCSALTDVSALSNWDVSNVTDFGIMFNRCSMLQSLKGLEKWNISKGNNFENMFAECNGLIDLSPISSWDVSNARVFTKMFLNCKGLKDLSPLKNWKVTNVSSFESMFQDCNSVKSIDFSSWDRKDGIVRNYKNMLSSIDGATFLSSFYFSAMKGTNLYVIGKTGYKDFKEETDLTSDPDNLIFGHMQVSYDKGDATDGTVPVAQHAEKGQTINLANNTGGLVKTGSTFIGWKCVEDGKEYAAGASFTLNENVTMQPNFKSIGYDVIYDNGGGTGSVPETKSYAEKDQVTVEGNIDLSKPGYSFAGWLSDADDKTYQKGDKFTMPAKAVTLTAQYEELGGDLYSIEYQMGEAESGTLPQNQSAKAGETVTLAKNTGGLAKADGSPFIGWKDQNGSAYTEGQQFLMPANNLTMTPRFASEKYMLRFVSDDELGGGSLPEPMEVYGGVTIQLPDSSGFQPKPDYVFEGWLYTKTEQLYQAGENFTMPEEAVTMKAVFKEAVYTLSYDPGIADFGTVPESVQVPGGSVVKLAANVGGLRFADYVFTGWTDDVNNYAAGGSFVMPFADVTMRPVFEAGIDEPVPLPEDEAGLYYLDENGEKVYAVFRDYALCMQYMGDEELCRSTCSDSDNY